VAHLKLHHMSLDATSVATLALMWLPRTTPKIGLGSDVVLGTSVAILSVQRIANVEIHQF
jgi:hypothetical protein